MADEVKAAAPAGERGSGEERRPGGGPGGDRPRFGGGGRGPGGPPREGGRKSRRFWYRARNDSASAAKGRGFSESASPSTPHESGKIVPRRLTGVCAPHQHRLSAAIKQARNIALLPFAGRAN